MTCPKCKGHKAKAVAIINDAQWLPNGSIGVTRVIPVVVTCSTCKGTGESK